MKIKTNRRWREFKLREDVPSKILKSQFDWTDKDHALYCDYSDGFIEYHGCWYHLSQFVRSGAPEGWQGAHGDSFFSGVVIRLSSDGERYQIGTYYS
jgi:hypothetical protein